MIRRRPNDESPIITNTQEIAIYEIVRIFERSYLPTLRLIYKGYKPYPYIYERISDIDEVLHHLASTKGCWCRYGRLLRGD